MATSEGSYVGRGRIEVSADADVLVSELVVRAHDGVRRAAGRIRATAAYARRAGVPVDVIWPAGATRD
ncbi:hypothetical protein DMH15_34965 [Streptomyces sp. WAC 06725]|nr:hypothetical protein DMH15_34965 [Streptomyces sp. WAC 06725]